ncbi:PREDICTED: aspartyl protease family protein At5g10770-like [Nelumbo nucifera]|uniref:Aspartyl protease family protein At5g10770-like n=1 Tax=Nelumbo nucifera TaxID=4432 RepID=A0A1U8AUM1_NELNU|nr:PREDICTED: aspartyl protease family protein At5g10770-like [Nelumbo nucifera]
MFYACISTISGFDNHPSGKLQLVDVNGPCSPLETTPSLEEILHQDQLRVRSIHSMINKHVRDSKAKIPTRFGLPFKTKNYVVNIGVGTPNQNLWVTMDTGSSLSWILCKTCPNCRGLPFSPSQSSSYSNIACGSADCSQAYSATHHSPACRDACIYQTQYADSDYSVGFFARETLRLTPSDVFPGFKLGCGHDVKLRDSTSGILGLGSHPASLVYQTATKFGKVFSYCLPSSTNSNGFLAFGNQTGSTSPAVRYIRLILNPQNPDLYYVPLNGISLNGRRLAIPASTFSAHGTVIDSGTIVSYLPPSAYIILRNAFRAAMSGYPSATPPRGGVYDTCYDLSRNRTVTIPSIKLNFGGGIDLLLDQYSGVITNVGSYKFCLAFSANDDEEETTIIGSIQQKTYEVIYDVPRGRLGFRSVGATCN